MQHILDTTHNYTDTTACRELHTHTHHAYTHNTTTVHCVYYIERYIKGVWFAQTD